MSHLDNFGSCLIYKVLTESDCLIRCDDCKISKIYFSLDTIPQKKLEELFVNDKINHEFANDDTKVLEQVFFCYSKIRKEHYIKFRIAEYYFDDDGTREYDSSLSFERVIDKDRCLQLLQWFCDQRLVPRDIDDEEIMRMNKVREFFCDNIFVKD